MVSTDYNNDWNKPLSQLKSGDKKIWTVTKKNDEQKSKIWAYYYGIFYGI